MLIDSLIKPEDSLLFGAYYAFTSGRVALDSDWNKKVTQVYFFRKIPKYLGSYILAVGLEQVIAHIRNCQAYTIQDEHIEWFEKTSGGDMTEEMMSYLANFDKHSMFNIWAVPEGTPMFPNEPIIMIEGEYTAIQIIEDALLSTMNHQSLVATKASRLRYACGRRALADFGARRAHGMGAGLTGARASYIGGCDGSSLVLAGYKFGIPYIGTVPHAFIQMRQNPDESFDATETKAFADYAKTFPHNSLLLVDTYSSINGIMNAIDIGKELRKHGYELKGIRLDSGDLVALSKMARTMLNSAGLQQAKIYLSDNIDEYTIVDMLEKGAEVDGFGVGTRLQTGANVMRDKGGVSALGGVLKMVEANGHPSMKFTDNPAKCTLPGKQQVWRVHTPQWQYREDYISTFEEVLNFEYAKPLLIQILKNGKVVYEFPEIKKIKSYCEGELKKIKRGFRRINEGIPEYPVNLSPALESLRNSLKKKYDTEFSTEKAPPSVDEQVEKYMKIVDLEGKIKDTIKWEVESKWSRVG